MTPDKSSLPHAPSRRISFPTLGKNFLLANTIRPLFQRPSRPRALCLYVTYRCNMRCRMCGIWGQSSKAQETDLSQEEFHRILSDPLFSDLEFVNINGGEPNLRNDLVPFAQMLIDLFPRLSTMSINSNGLPPQKTVDHIEKISRACRARGIRFSVSISLHGAGERHDEITGVPDAYSRVKDGLDRLREMRLDGDFYLSVNCVITGLNVRDLEAMLGWGDQQRIPVNFTLGEVRERFMNLDIARTVQVADQDRASLVRFLRHLSRDKRRFRQHALRYSHIADMLEYRRKRTLACHYALAGVILGSDGLLYYCKNSKAIGNALELSPTKIYFDPQNLDYRRKALFNDRCAVCPPNTYNIIEVEKDLLKLMRFWLMGR